MSGDAPLQRRTIAVFDDYGAAERAVDHLADAGFPVERVAIVGRDLRYVEQVTGRMTTGVATALGALQGAGLGSLFALAFGLIFTFSPSPALPLLVVYGVISGAAIGALLGALTHAAGGGRRDFSSARAVVAGRYELVADADVADRAEEVLRGLDAASGAGAEARGVPA